MATSLGWIEKVIITSQSYYDMAEEADLREFIVKVTDFGSYMSKYDLQRSVQISTLRRIVKAMGGRLKVESSIEETTFSCSFPCSIV